jgi:hypothetical protein
VDMVRLRLRAIQIHRSAEDSARTKGHGGLHSAIVFYSPRGDDRYPDRLHHLRGKYECEMKEKRAGDPQRDLTERGRKTMN